MTTEGMIASLVWSAVAGYTAWRADLFLVRALAHRQTQHADAVSIKTRQVAIEEARLAGDEALRRDAIASAERIALTEAERARLAKLANRPVSALEIPDDLEAVAMQESEEWARDNERALIRQRFQELFTGDDRETWQKVRSAVGIAEMP